MKLATYIIANNELSNNFNSNILLRYMVVMIFLITIDVNMESNTILILFKYTPNNEHIKDTASANKLAYKNNRSFLYDFKYGLSKI